MMRLTTFASGSSGNCALLQCGGTSLLLDAGISFRRIRDALAVSGLTIADLSAVLVTHEHSDHISGIATMLRHSGVPFFAPRTVLRRLCAASAGVEARMHPVAPGKSFNVGEVRVTPFATPHDTAESVGWRVEGDGVFGLATDLGCVTDEIFAGLAGADAVLIEANHDVDMLRAGPYPAALKRRILSDHGHLSNERCGELAAYLSDRGTQYIVLGHLSRENNTPDRAYRAVADALAGRDARLYTAPADGRFTVEFGRAEACSR